MPKKDNGLETIGAELDDLADAFRDKLLALENALDEHVGRTGKGPSGLSRRMAVRRTTEVRALAGTWASVAAPLPGDVKRLSFAALARQWSQIVGDDKKAA
jgi:hypothetical protein